MKFGDCIDWFFKWASVIGIVILIVGLILSKVIIWSIGLGLFSMGIAISVIEVLLKK